MAITRPCIKAQMGSTTYFQTTMTGRELASSVRAAKDTDSWASSSIEERMQREYNWNRIKDSIVPYLANHPDRLFGSLIVLIQGGEVNFESLADVVDKVPGAYRSSRDKLGFLTIEGGELIALDGQHRLLAFREVVQSAEPLGEFASQVGDDEVGVIFLWEDDTRKVRRIFNKVNRHAKTTGRSDNIITSEDDGNAIVTRRLMDTDLDAPLAAKGNDGALLELVNWTSNTLTKRSKRLTTISAVYETVKDILQFEEFRGFDEKSNPVSPPDEDLDRAYGAAARWWTAILSMEAFAQALKEMDKIAEKRNSQKDPHSLLLRPVGQIALVKGLTRALTRSKGKLSLDDAVKRADKINWSASPQGMWRDSILRSDGRMIARKEAYELAAELIAYQIGSEFMTDKMQDELFESWNKARGKDISSPVEDLDSELMPEDLPDPVNS